MILKNFIVFEGIDGSGTTTQLNNLRARFAEEGNSRVRFTFEPTDGETGKFIRRILGGAFSVHADTLAHLFAADRNEHLYGKNGVLSQLEAGNAVFSDRYLFSSLVYQGESGSRGLPQLLNRVFPMPEYLFFFDLEPETAMRRVSARAEAEKSGTEIFEKLEFQKKARAAYRAVVGETARLCPEMRVVTVDASLPPEEITRNIWTTVKNLPKME